MPRLAPCAAAARLCFAPLLPRQYPVALGLMPENKKC